MNGNQCPRRRADVSVEQRSGTTILVSGAGAEMALNHTAVALWDLCDGRTTTEEMVTAIDKFFDADTQVIRNDVDVMLRELTERGCLEWTSGG